MVDQTVGMAIMLVGMMVVLKVAAMAAMTAA